MTRLTLLACGVLAAAAAAETRDQKKAKEALQELNEFIGKWSGSGGPPLGRRGTDADLWKESLNWGWRFEKSGDAALVLDVDGGRHYKSAVMRYLPAKRTYEMKAVTAAGDTKTFTGQLRRGRLTLTHQDPKTKNVERLTLSTNNNGVRLIYQYATQSGGRGIFRRKYMVQHTREGASIARRNKRECVVSGGLGTIAVSYMGKTYYVCCSGCAEAFREDPTKFIKK